VFSYISIFKCRQQLAAWSAMAMLFLQPFGVSVDACSCDSPEFPSKSSEVSCCSSTVSNEAAEMPCCISPPKTCCCETGDDEIAPCCSARNGADLSVYAEKARCSCGTDCCCAGSNSPDFPPVVLPSYQVLNNEWQNTALCCSFSIAKPSIILLNAGQSQLDVMCGRSSRSTCALLSRFQC